MRGPHKCRASHDQKAGLPHSAIDYKVVESVAQTQKDLLAEYEIYTPPFTFPAEYSHLEIC